MKIRGNSFAQEAIFPCRIYSIFSAVVFYCVYLNASFCQEIGSYRTVASGNFGNSAIWEVYDGLGWTSASTKPTLANDIYIEQPHLLTLTGNEEAKSVFLNSDAGATQKLNLNNYNLNIYGTLQAFDGATPGIPAGAHNSSDWIGSSLGSTITFKGISRTIILDAAWSGNAQNSNYSVIFDPGPGIELSIEEPFKALRFTIKSGAVVQKLTNTGICSSFSFNINNSYGLGTFGNFIIENGGTLVSNCNGNILFRSTSRSANLFDLQAGGELILEGTNPRIEAANFQLDGKVTFRAGSTQKTLLSSTFADAGAISSFHELEVQGIRNVLLPPSVTITGGMTQTGSGKFLMNNTHLSVVGTADQVISGFALDPQDMTVNKADGEVLLTQGLSVLRNLNMLDGILNFQDNTLTINSSNAGVLNYQGGSWENLSSFTYANSPTAFNAANGTFPFGDRYQGGIRKVQLLGTNAGGNLSINYIEYKGADFNPSFNDLDGTPILYRLFSYFNFSGLNFSSNPLEMRISADKLIVDDPEDLRLVCTGYAAPGNHIESTDAINLWAIRSLTFDDLTGKNFTVGSFRTLSILPVTWLTLSAYSKDNVKQISWSVASENENEKFEIYRSENPSKEWNKIGHVLSKGNSDSPVFYAYSDESLSNSTSTYYQIRLVDLSGQWSWSNIVRLESKHLVSNDQISISPNPHFSGKISISLPKSFNLENSQISIYTVQGNLMTSINTTSELTDKLEMLPPGLYIIHFSNPEMAIQSRWIKR
ncbi:T9SS type A sorting domain-containing protein [Algoriphagus sp. C2-6-M1]|uniref:T9SS type A sorting domain-containing protein n=1 Tax=Algoriphagus persicinus TaxID=3108754 RepID=UPI002B3FDA45|nr:T9SS type A sorting domain-containing protein [Algoriphagus sp. C2-6-M1]MEB2780310.1 T9SS type A sorting domain-containing protein [Algoriphagus sp. C2-6-M1]